MGDTILSLEEFKPDALLAYIEERKLPFDPKLTSLLPKDEKTWDIDFAYDIVKANKNAAASIMPFGAAAPLREGGETKTVIQEVAKLVHGRRIDEREQLKFMNPRTEDEKQQIINKIYDMVDKLTTGVYKMEEFLRAAVLYQGKLLYDNNNVKLNIDFGIPNSQKTTLTGTSKWTDYANAKPLEDLIDHGRLFADANGGMAPKEIHISRKVLFDILACKNTIDSIKGTAGGMVTIDELNEFLSKFQLPSLTVNDENIYFYENKKTERLLPERRVAFLGIQGEHSLGSTVEGPTVKNGGNPGIYVDTIVDPHTVNETIEIGAAAFPALKYTSGVFHLDV